MSYILFKSIYLSANHKIEVSELLDYVSEILSDILIPIISSQQFTNMLIHLRFI